MSRLKDRLHLHEEFRVFPSALLSQLQTRALTKWTRG